MSGLQHRLEASRSIYFARLERSHVGYENEDERRFLLIERMRDDVVDICRSQIVFASARNSLRPTFLVRTAEGGRELVTVRAHCDPLFAYRHNALRESAHEAGFEMRLLTSSLLKSGHPLANAEMIEQATAPREAVLSGYVALYTGRPRTVSELATLLPESANAMSVALRLAYFGEIAFDPDRPIDCEARFRFTPKDLSKTLGAYRAASVH